MKRSISGWSVGLIFLTFAEWSYAADVHQPLEVAYWSVAPFVLMLLSIALLPILAAHFWHSNLNRFLVSMLLSAPIVGYLIYLNQVEGKPGLEKLEHALLEYFNFIVLLGSLYVISGGIVVQGNITASPWKNGFLLLFGAALSNLVGTTGASMLLIRPFLRTNAYRFHRTHLPVFFIFMVSNCGGLLTPLGDPPLFLGYLRGIPFWWTFRLWPEWLVANGSILLIFLIWDSIAFRIDRSMPISASDHGPVRIGGLFNLVLLAGVVAAVLLQSPEFQRHTHEVLKGVVDTDTILPNLKTLPEPWHHLEHLWPSLVMIGMAILSLLLTPSRLRQANEFGWGAIIEVAVLFLGIFITMVPALAVLEKHSHDLGLTEPWQYYWLTGTLSSFLDNAPTYLTFATIAAHGRPIATLAIEQPMILEAISAGAVFMGSMTYIGNGPNFMVKAIADESGYEMPSFFGYMLYSCLILLPIFLAMTYAVFLAPRWLGVIP